MVGKTEIILVDKKDEAMGKGEKMWVHQKGKLHRAFSIFLFNKKGEMLLQQRAKTKYHSGGLWANACCSHPRAGKKIEEEAKKRLKDEMGIICPLKEVFSFIYKAKVGDLIEYEFDHIFLGNYNGRPKINKEEADDWKWVRPNELIKNVKKNPKKYAAWFKKIFKKVLEWEKIEKKLSLQKLYKELYLKYGRPAGQWKLWCKRPKTSKEREEVIIGAILTQRANWKNVELAINNLKKARVCSIKGIYGMGERNKKNLANLVKPSGFFQQKADYLFNLAKYILKKYKSIGKMKKENTFDLRKGLLSQKGIGKETADSILLYALDKPVFVIDEYTRRLVGLKQYDFLQELFEKNLNPPSLPPSLKLLRTRKLWRARNNYRLYQDFHALIVIDGKTK